MYIVKNIDKWVLSVHCHACGMTLSFSHHLVMKKRPLIVICRCKSHCTSLNVVTGIYEGDGMPQSRSTRDRHARDDKNLISSTVLYRAPPAPNSSPDDWIRQIFEEVQLLMEQPLTSVQYPLAFKFLPEENGPFVWPNDDNILNFNHGLHSLNEHKANRPFLTLENRLQNLYFLAFRNLAQSDDDTQDRINTLLLYIRENIYNLIRTKEVEWAQQRGTRGVSGPYVNTGECLGTSILFLC